jgi:hypothetical protein
MRLAFGAVLCLFLAFLGVGCRKSLSPNVDNNLAPETWITAAPQDTITERSPVGSPIPPVPADVPVRFHLYWAGSDKDGAVTGFYWAVTETLPIPPGDGIPLPGLPGPKPHDYHYTSRTDSIFIFRASEDVSVREHTFYIYAVDDKGKADPTPARFMFRAYDRFPPLAIIDTARATGTVFKLQPGGGVVAQEGTYFITDSFDVSRPFPRDTVPASAQLTFSWHGEPTIPSTRVTGFRYKLDEPNFNIVDSTVRVVSYNTRVGSDVVAPGVKKFTLRAVGESGWRGESTRYFQMNFAPDSWFSGPDVNNPAEGWQSFVDGNGKRYYYKDVNWANYSRGTGVGFPGIPGTMLSPDSVQIMPASRPDRRTFFEFYADRIWAHAEFDTVHLNSWVLLPSGGYDPDSPYLVKVGVTDNYFPGGPVLVPSDQPNGSPIGFRANITTTKPDGGQVRPSESTTYPVFDLASSFDAERISYRGGMTSTGKAYAYVVSEDGDGTVDRRLFKYGGAEAIADHVDAGVGTPAEIAVRSKVLVFYVNHAPRVDSSAVGFVPRPRSTIHGVNQTFNLICSDIDPIDDTKESTIGGPQNPPSPVLIKTVKLIQYVGADSIVQTVCADFPGQNPNFTPDAAFQNGPMTVRIQLWDGRPNSSKNFSRRETVVNIPVTYSVTGPADATMGDNSGTLQPTQRPGSTQAAVRRQ